MNNNFLAKDRFASYVGISLHEVKPGYAVAKLMIKPEHLNGVNIVHGGLTFTLADFAFAAASNFAGQVSLGINAFITYFKPPQGKELIAEATEIQKSGKLAVYNVDIFDEDINMIARFTGTAYRKKDPIAR